MLKTQHKVSTKEVKTPAEKEVTAISSDKFYFRDDKTKELIEIDQRLYENIKEISEHYNDAAIRNIVSSAFFSFVATVGLTVSGILSGGTIPLFFIATGLGTMLVSEYKASSENEKEVKQLLKESSRK